MNFSCVFLLYSMVDQMFKLSLTIVTIYVCIFFLSINAHSFIPISHSKVGRPKSTCMSD